MIESMTGFGYGKAQVTGNSVAVSLRSLNNRSFKLNTRLPEGLVGAQQEIEELLKSRIRRGMVYCYVESDGMPSVAFTLDEETVLGYCRRLRSLARKAGLPDDIRIERVAALPGALREHAAKSTVQRELLMKAARKALTALVASRRKEGAKIEEEVRRLLDRIVAICKRVAQGRMKFLKEYQKKLSSRIEELLGEFSFKVSQMDVAREVATLAERSDIAEELQRLNMHTEQMAKVLSGKKPAGRQLEFIAQEMLREASTMGAKSISSKLVVPLLELKGHIDKIREQAQNIQ